MHRKLMSMILTWLLVIGLLGDTFSQVSYANNNVNSSETEVSEISKFNIPEVYTLTINDILGRFPTTETFVKQQMNDGFSLNDIYNVFFQAEEMNISYEDARHLLYPAERNLSESVISEVYSTLPGPILQKINLVEAETVTELVYDDIKTYSMEQNKLKLKESVSDYNKLSVTDEVYTDSSSSILMRSAVTSENPVLEKPPVYRKTSFNEAPYTVGSNQETVSSLSGSLFMQNTDLSLPGRNGMSFDLTRQYNTKSAQFYEEDFGSNTYSYDFFKYEVQLDAVKKKIIPKYNVNVRETYKIEYDYNNDGVVDSRAPSAENNIYLAGSYENEADAKALRDRIPNTQYLVPADTVIVYQSFTSNTNSFPSYKLYNANEFSGTLYTTGSSYVASGSLTTYPSRTESSICENTTVGMYTKGVWSQISAGTSCPGSVYYSNSGYTGTLSRTGEERTKNCISPREATVNGECKIIWTAYYSGTVTKPSVDTRTYGQDYSGSVTKSAYYSYDRYSNWSVSASTSGRSRYVYSRFGAPWVDPVYEEAKTGTGVKLPSELFDYRSDAMSYANVLNSMGGTYINQVQEADGIWNYYIATTPNARVVDVYWDTYYGSEYYNTTKKPLEESLYPLGKGWSWKLPYLETKEGKTLVHLAEGGSYEVEGNKLKGYEWEGPVYQQDTSVTLNGETSQSVLISADGTIRQYFSDDGRLLQISDPYNNTIQFAYKQNATYGRKLLDQVKDALGNTIHISYTTTAVNLTQGNRTVVYNKVTREGIELLESVTDQIGRKTTFSYEIKDAKFNLMADYPERGLSNPYALLSKVQHPTGAETEYSYELHPVKRYIGSDSFSEEYRLSSRKDIVTYENNKKLDYNRQTYFYNNSDMGSSYGQDVIFSTTIDNGLTSNTFNYKKDYIDTVTPPQFYLESSVKSAQGVEEKSSYAYNKFLGSRTYSASVPTSVTLTDNKTADILATMSKYDDYGNITESVDAKGNTTVYIYDDTRHLLKSVLKPVNTGMKAYTMYTRNAQGSVTQVKTTSNDASGELLGQIDFGSFDAYGNATTQSIINGNKAITTTIEYSEQDKYAFPRKQKVNVTDGKGNTTEISISSQYNLATGELLSSTDGNKNQTQYLYDALGRILKVTNPDNSTLSAVYDDINNTVTVTDEEGIKARTQWNALGWEIESGLFEADGYKKKSATAYDSYGRVEWKQDALGNKIQYKFDNWSRPISTVNADMTEAITKYDDALRLTTVIDAEGYTLIQTYDKWGRVTKLEEQVTANSTATQLEKLIYNNINDLVTEQEDGKGNKTAFTYNYNGNLISVNNAKGEVTQYSYDILGNQLTTIFPDGTVKSKFYDELSRVLSTTDESGLKETFGYDANGNLLNSTDRSSNVTNFLYDSRNRLIQRKATDETVDYTYDHSGKRLSMNDTTGKTGYRYNPYTGLLEGISYSDGLKLEIPEYDASGNRKVMNNPFGTTTEYRYDAMNRLDLVGTTLATPDADYTYYRNGLLQQTMGKNGIASVYKYTGLDLTSLQHNRTMEELNNYEYKYDANKNIESRTQNGTVEQFGYDSLNRISNTMGSSSESYTYDSRGNRLSMSSTGPVNIQEAEYVYDKQNRLIQAKTNGETVQYGYNGDGLLVNRTQDGVTTRYYYDGDQIISEATIVNGTPQLVASYIRGTKLEAIQYTDGTKVYPLYNGHGDLVELRDEVGELLNRYTYDNWGNITSEEEQVHNPFRYSGELWDDTTNLQYLRARWYDPSVGRFLNEDTYEGQIDNPLSLNLYTYVSNNPLIYSDPSGMCGVNSWGDAGDCFSKAWSGTKKAASWSAKQVNYGWNYLSGTVEWKEVVLGGLQAVGGFTEMTTGAAIAIGGSETGVLIAAGGYLAIDGSSNLAGGSSRIMNGFKGSQAGDTWNFMKAAYHKLDSSDTLYNISQIGIGVFTIGKGISELPTGAGSVEFGSGWSKAFNGAKTTTTTVQNKNLILIETRLVDSTLVRSVQIDLTKIGSGTLLIGIDGINAKQSYTSVKP